MLSPWCIRWFLVLPLVLAGLQHTLFGTINNIMFLLDRAPHEYERTALGAVCLGVAYVVARQERPRS